MGFKAGDPAPEGYLAWHSWAYEQDKAGLRQVRCGCCTLWNFPQELSSVVIESMTYNRRGDPVGVTKSRVCLKCETKMDRK